MEENCCEVERQSFNNFMQENYKLIGEIKGISREIECTILGTMQDEQKQNENSCLLQAIENQNIDLRETLQIMLKIRNTLIAK